MKKHLRLLRKKSYVLVLYMLMGAPMTAQTYLDNFFSVHGGFATIDGVSYFFATSTHGESGLWKTDGTQTGTEMVKPISIGLYDSKDLFVYQNELYFSAVGISGPNELWKSDGTEFGTHALRDASDEERAIVSPSNFMVYDNILYFEAKGNTSNQRTIYRTDGTPEGTGKATNIVTPDASGSLKAVANGKLYFSSIGILQETDGTMEGTKNNIVDGLAYSGEYHSFGSGLYFITHNYNKTYIRLYRLTDIDNYTMIKEFSTESHGGLELYGLAEIDGKVVFSVVSGETYSSVKDTLWATDGTPEGTTELMSVGDGDLWFRPNFTGFADYRGELYFNAGPATENALWKTDGTKQGTIEVNKDANVNKEAPMLVLNDKLYFLNGTSLHTYDGSLQETNQVWQLRSARKSTGDDYFVKSDGRYIYSMVRNLWDDKTNTMDFFHTGANPLMQVSVPYGFIKQETLNFEAKVDSVAIKEISVKNIGNIDLAFSKVHVSGEGFYINGETEVGRYGQKSKIQFSQKLAPDHRGVFQIGFLPGSPGAYTGHLIIRSNDTSRPEYRLELRGYASDIPPNSINATFPTEKEINWKNSEAQFDLDNNLVSENATSGTVIGRFMSVSGAGNFSYQMVQGSGSSGNTVFEINNDQLVVGDEFQANNKKSYTIRVKATDSDGSEYEESIVIGVEEESIEVQLGACEQIAVSLTSDLYDVDFLNDTDAIAVGAQGIILKTTDKGSTWEQLHVIERTSPYLVNAGLHDVQFVDDNIGFVLGSNTLLRTDDAGVSWKPLKIENLNSYRNVKLWTISSNILFLLVNNYQSGNSLYISNDGGRTWDDSSFIGFRDMVSLYFYDDTFGLVSDTWEGYYITNDGGRSWTHYELELDELSFNEDITGFSFIDGKVGYASTQNGKVLKTEDGGLSWSLVNSDYRNSIGQIHFIDEDKGYLVDGSIYETTDGGLNWNMATLGNCVAVKAVSFNNLGDKIAVGTGCYTGNGRSIYTASPSSSWNEVSAIYGTREIREVIIDGQEIYLFSSSQSRKSFDGGITWKEFNTPLGRDLYYADKIGDVIYIKGSNGPFYKSIDEGENWTKTGNGEAFSNYDIVNEDTIFAYGAINGGMANIFSSTDGGLNWTTLPIFPDSGSLVEFLDVSIGYVGGSGLSRTRDGGLSWERLDLGTSDAFYVYGMEFSTEQYGIISTNQGFYKTNDGGDTWFKLDLLAPYTRSIIAGSDQDWFIKSATKIYKTNNGGLTWQLLYNAQNDVHGLDFFEDSLYFSDDDGGVYKLVQDPQPLNAGFINGDKVVRVGDQEIYTVAKHSDNNYVWTVSGSNNMVSENNFARVTWNEPGTYTLKVTPYGSCSTGTPETITVEVYEPMAPPEINGPNEVVEGSNGIVYTTPQEEQVGYVWSVTGQRSFHTNGNTLTVDWGTIGQQEIGLVKTDLLSGIRTYNSIEVDVLPVDPFTILQTNTSCRDTPNGSLQITSRLPAVAYEATLTTIGYSSSKEFSNHILFEALATGVYDLCIDERDTDKSYCYQFSISEPEPFEVSSKKVSGSVKKISLEFKGGLAPYTILVNGNFLAETSQSHYELTAAEDDVLEVLTSGNCTFSYSEVLNFNRNIAVSPNPVMNSLKAILGKDFNQEVKSIPISFFNSAGRLAFRTSAEISDHTLECDVSVLPSGIYMAQVGNERQISFKIIKQ